MQILTTMAKKWKQTLGVGLLLSIAAYAGTISRVHTFSDGDILTAAQMNAEFDNVIDGVNSITDDNIAAGAAINPLKISSSIAGAGITRNVSTGQLTPTVDGSTIEVGGSGIQVKDAGIDEDALASNAVTNAKVADNAIGNAELQDDAVNTAEILNSAVTTAKINDGAVTQVKREALNIQTSASGSGAFGTISASFVDVTNLTVTITTTGRPVFMGLVPDTGFSSGGISGTVNGALRFVEGSTGLSSHTVSISSGSAGWPPSAFWFIYTPAAGTYTYKVQAKTAGTLSVTQVKLLAYEL